LLLPEVLDIKGIYTEEDLTTRLNIAIPEFIQVAGILDSDKEIKITVDIPEFIKVTGVEPTSKNHTTILDIVIPEMIKVSGLMTEDFTTRLDVTVPELVKITGLINAAELGNVKLNIVVPESVNVNVTDNLENLATITQKLSNAINSVITETSSKISTIDVDVQHLEKAFDLVINKVAEMVSSAIPSTTTSNSEYQIEAIPESTDSRNKNKINELFNSSFNAGFDINEAVKNDPNSGNSGEIQALVKQKIQNLKEMLSLFKEIGLVDSRTAEQIAVEISNLRNLASKGLMSSANKGQYSKALGVKSGTEEYKAAYSAVGSLDVSASNNLGEIPAVKNFDSVTNILKGIENDLHSKAEIIASAGESFLSATELKARAEALGGSIQTAATTEAASLRNDANIIKAQMQQLRKTNYEGYIKFVNFLASEFKLDTELGGLGGLMARTTGNNQGNIEKTSSVFAEKQPRLVNSLLNKFIDASGNFVEGGVTKSSVQLTQPVEPVKAVEDSGAAEARRQEILVQQEIAKQNAALAAQLENERKLLEAIEIVNASNSIVEPVTNLVETVQETIAEAITEVKETVAEVKAKAPRNRRKAEPKITEDSTSAERLEALTSYNPENENRAAIAEYKEAKARVEKAKAAYQIADLKELNDKFNAISNPSRSLVSQNENFVAKIEKYNSKRVGQINLNELRDRTNSFVNNESSEDMDSIKRAIQNLAKSKTVAVKDTAQLLSMLDKYVAMASRLPENVEGAGLTPTAYKSDLKTRIAAFNKALDKIKVATELKVKATEEELEMLESTYESLYDSQKTSRNLINYNKAKKANSNLGVSDNKVESEESIANKAESDRKTDFNVKAAKALLAIKTGEKLADSYFNDLEIAAEEFNKELNGVKAKLEVNRIRNLNSNSNNPEIVDSSNNAQFNYDKTLATKQIKVGDRPNADNLFNLAETDFQELDARFIEQADKIKQRGLALKKLKDSIKNAKRQAVQGDSIVAVDFEGLQNLSAAENLDLRDEILNIEAAYQKWWQNFDKSFKVKSEKDFNSLISSLKSQIRLGDNVNVNGITTNTEAQQLKVRELEATQNKTALQKAKSELARGVLISKNQIRSGEAETFDFSYLDNQGIAEEIKAAMLDLARLRKQYQGTNQKANKEFADKLKQEKKNFLLGGIVDFDGLNAKKYPGNIDQEQSIQILGEQNKNSELKRATAASLETGNTFPLEVLKSKYADVDSIIAEVLNELSEAKIKDYIAKTKLAARGAAVGVNNVIAESELDFDNLSANEKLDNRVVIAQRELFAKLDKINRARIIELVKNKDLVALQEGADSGLAGYAEALNALKANSNRNIKNYSENVKAATQRIARGETATNYINNLKNADNTPAEIEQIRTLEFKSENNANNKQFTALKNNVERQKRLKYDREEIPDSVNEDFNIISAALKSTNLKPVVDKYLHDFEKWKKDTERAFNYAEFSTARTELKLGNDNPMKAIERAAGDFAKQATVELNNAAKKLAGLSAIERSNLTAYQSAARVALTNPGSQEDVKNAVNRVLKEFEGKKLSSTNQVYNDKFDTVSNSLKAASNQEGLAPKNLKIQDLAIAFYTLTNGISMATVALNNLAETASAYSISVQRLTVAAGGDTNQVNSDISFSSKLADDLKLNRQSVLNTLAGYKISNPTNYDEFGSRVSKPVDDAGINKVVSGLSAAGVANQLSADEMKNAAMAIQQMLSKGVVQSEELRRQLSNSIPGAFNLFAQSQGVSPKGLEGRLRRNEVTSDQIVDFGRLLEDQFSEAAKKPTVVRSVNTLINKSIETVQAGSAVPGAATSTILDNVVNPLVEGFSKNASTLVPAALVLGAPVGYSLAAGILKGLNESDTLGAFSKDFVSKFKNQNGTWTNLGKATGLLFTAGLVSAIGAASGGEGIDKLLTRFGKNVSYGVSSAIGAITGETKKDEKSPNFIKSTLGSDLVSQIAPLALGLFSANTLLFGKGENKPKVPEIKPVAANVKDFSFTNKEGQSFKVPELKNAAINAATPPKENKLIAGAGAAAGAVGGFLAANWVGAAVSIAASLAAYSIANSKFVSDFREATTDLTKELKAIADKIGTKPGSSGLTDEEIKNRTAKAGLNVLFTTQDQITDKFADSEALKRKEYKSLSDEGLVDVNKNLQDRKNLPGFLKINAFGNEDEIRKGVEEELDRRKNRGGYKVNTDYNQNVTTGLAQQDYKDVYKIVANNIKTVENARDNKITFTPEEVVDGDELTKIRKKREAIFNKSISTREEREELDKTDSDLTRIGAKYKKSIEKYTIRVTALETSLKKNDVVIDSFEKNTSDTEKNQPKGADGRNAYDRALDVLKASREAIRQQLVKARKDQENVDPAIQTAKAAEKYADVEKSINDRAQQVQRRKAIINTVDVTQRYNEDNDREANFRKTKISVNFATADLKISEEKLKTLREFYQSLFKLPPSDDSEKKIQETKTKLLEAETTYQENILKLTEARLVKQQALETKNAQILELKVNRQNRAAAIVESFAKNVEPTYSNADTVNSSRLSAQAAIRAKNLQDIQVNQQAELVRKSPLNREALNEKLGDMIATQQEKNTQARLAQLAFERSQIELITNANKDLAASVQAVIDTINNSLRIKSEQRIAAVAAPISGDLNNTDRSLIVKNEEIRQLNIQAAQFKTNGIESAVDLYNSNSRARFSNSQGQLKADNLNATAVEVLKGLSPTEVAQLSVSLQKAATQLEQNNINKAPNTDAEPVRFGINAKIGNLQTTTNSPDTIKDFQELLKVVGNYSLKIQEFDTSKVRLEQERKNIVITKNNENLKDTRDLGQNTEGNKREKQAQLNSVTDSRNLLNNRFDNVGNTNPNYDISLKLLAVINDNKAKDISILNENAKIDKITQNEVEKRRASLNNDRASLTPEQIKVRENNIKAYIDNQNSGKKYEDGSNLNRIFEVVIQGLENVAKNIPRVEIELQNYQNLVNQKEGIQKEAGIGLNRTDEYQKELDTRRKANEFNTSLKVKTAELSRETGESGLRKVADSLRGSTKAEDILIVEKIDAGLKKLAETGGVTEAGLKNLVESFKSLGFSFDEIEKLVESAVNLVKRKNIDILNTAILDNNASSLELKYSQEDKISPFASDETKLSRNNDRRIAIKADYENKRNQLETERLENDPDNLKPQLYAVKRSTLDNKEKKELGEIETPGSKIAKDISGIVEGALKFSQVFREGLANGKWGDAIKKMFGNLADSIADYFSNKAASAIAKGVGSFLDSILSGISFKGFFGLSDGLMPTLNSGLMPSYSMGDMPSYSMGKSGSAYPNTPNQDFREYPAQSKFAIIGANEWVVPGKDANDYVAFKQAQFNQERQHSITNVATANNSVSTVQYISNNYSQNPDSFRRSKDTEIAINSDESSRKRFSKR
jgi:tape measure domain-containing protein